MNPYDPEVLAGLILAARGVARPKKMSKSSKAKGAKTRRSPFIKEWRSSWRFLSMQANALSLAMIATYAAMPDKLQDAIPAWLVMGLAVSMLLLGMLGRLLKQKGSP